MVCRARCRARVEELRPYGPKLLAEKIETRDRYEICRDVEFDYFQGFFLARPRLLQSMSIPVSRVNLLQLLSELQDPACDMSRIQELVSQDVTLSYKLLRHINAATYGMPRRIESISETVVYLGQAMVSNLACLLMLSQIGDSPRELLVTAMLRAKMCENLAQAAQIEPSQRYFTVGLFSTLDALMSAPMAAILSKLPLVEELRVALLMRRGQLGEALRCTIAYERGDWDRVSCFGLTPGEIKSAFLDAVCWTEEADRELLSPAA